MAKKKFNKECFKNPNNYYDRKYLGDAFLRGIAFGKNVADFNGKTAIMSIECKDDIVFAVKKAYIDMSPRTFKKNNAWWESPDNAYKEGKERLPAKELSWQEEKASIFAWLAEKFHVYFHKPCENFEEWHEQTCDEFIKKFKPVLENYGYDADQSLKYGKAQKIVNMTFKYLFCFDDAEKYEVKFEACHMPIDSYILNWYNDICDENCKTVWSELEKNQYYALEEKIKTLLDGKNPFLAEFFIWAEYNN